MGALADKLNAAKSGNGTMQTLAQKLLVAKSGNQITSDNIIQNLSQKILPGANSAAFPTKPAGQTGLGISDVAKSIPNAFSDIWNLVKEVTYGTAKKVGYEIPKEAFNLVKEQGLGGAIKNTIKSVPSAVGSVGYSLIPESLKQIGNTDALQDIPSQFKNLVKDNGGSYANALLSIVKAVPTSIPTAVINYANQIDRSRQALENHPVNEFLGYLGLKSLIGDSMKSETYKNPTLELNAPKSGILSPFTGSYKPDVAELFKKEGIKAPVSALTNSQFLRQGEAIAAKGIFGQKINEIVKTANEEVQKRTDDIISKVKPEKGISDESLGKVVQEGLQEYKKNFELTEGKIYDEFNKVYGKSQVFGGNTKNILADILEEQKLDQFKGVDPRLQKMFNRLTGADNPEVKDLIDQINEFKSKGKGMVPRELTQELIKKQIEVNKPLNFTDLKSTRTAVGEALTREPDNSSLKRLYGALSKDMQLAVKQVGDASPFERDSQVAFEALKKLNEDYATGKAKIASNISQSINMSNPESIANNIIKRNSAETLKLVRGMITEPRFKQVQESFMRKIFEDSVTRGEFDVKKLEKKLDSYDTETIGELVNPDQYNILQKSIEELNKLSRMKESLKAGQKVAVGSQTAFVAKVTGLTQAILTGNFSVAGAILLGDLSLRTLFGTDFGRKLLTEGLTKINLKVLKDYKGLSETNKQLIIQNMRTKKNE